MAARMLYATGVFVVFGAVALGIAWSASADWREGRREGDRVTLFYAVQQWWPALIAAAVAVVVPVVILVR
ncbi:MAG: hypothetical protein JO291_03210 [Acidimicrobiia bacterium]|nr:hypothetical protein [Acidimicrobiia bacterium]